MVKKYRLQMSFNKEERKGFVVTTVYDSIIERDDMPTIIESFTHGYDANPLWYGLKILVGDCRE